jgi:hypothetical protein
MKNNTVDFNKLRFEFNVCLADYLKDDHLEDYFMIIYLNHINETVPTVWLAINLF